MQIFCRERKTMWQPYWRLEFSAVFPRKAELHLTQRLSSKARGLSKSYSQNYLWKSCKATYESGCHLWRNVSKFLHGQRKSVFIQLRPRKYLGAIRLKKKKKKTISLHVCTMLRTARQHCYKEQHSNKTGWGTDTHSTPERRLLALPPGWNHRHDHLHYSLQTCIFPLVFWTQLRQLDLRQDAHTVGFLRSSTWLSPGGCS